MKLSPLLSVAALALAGIAGTGALNAQGTPSGPPGAVDPARVTGGQYSADPQHTLVGWRLDHMGFNAYFGTFGQARGTLLLDRADLTRSNVELTIPITSLAITSEALRDHLFRPGQGDGAPDFFGPDPAAAHFVSTSVRPGADDPLTAQITGDLTLNGVTRPVLIQARFTGAGTNPMSGAETVGFEGKAVIERSTFNLGYGVPMVGDAVELSISAAFEKGGRAPEPAPTPSPTAPASPTPIATTAQSCGRDLVAGYVGDRATPAVRSEVAARSRAQDVRWLGKGAMATQDFRPERLNAYLSAEGNVIERFACG